MTKQEWLAQVKENEQPLTSFLQNFHPLKEKKHNVTITAPAAQEYRNDVCRYIIEKGGTDPVDRFQSAIELEDCRAIYTLLEEAWFGVPETTDCWKFKGFSEAVSILDNPPEEEI